MAVLGGFRYLSRDITLGPYVLRKPPSKVLVAPEAPNKRAVFILV